MSDRRRCTDLCTCKSSLILGRNSTHRLEKINHLVASHSIAPYVQPFSLLQSHRALQHAQNFPSFAALSDQHQDQCRDIHQWPSSTANHAQKQTRTSLPEKSPGSRNSPSPITEPQLTSQPTQETRGCILPRPRHRSPHKNTPVIKCIPSKVTWLRYS